MRTINALLLVGLGVGIAAALVALGDRSGSRGRRTQVESDLRSILTAAHAFHREKGRWPESIDELAAPETPFAAPGPCNVALDPWRNPYLFELADGVPRVSCLGSDGQPGGEGEAADRTFRLQDGTVRE